MRSIFVKPLVTGMLLLACGYGASLLYGCFAPVYADCAFLCGDSEPKCPSEYVCKEDGYCHLPDSEAICAFPVFPDLSKPVDLGPTNDALTSSDGL